MKKILFILFAFLSFYCAAQTRPKSYVKEEEFSGMELAEVTKKFGKKYTEYFYTVDKDYEFRSEAEPNYIKYFSQEEFENGTEVCARVWEKPDKTIVVWAKKYAAGIWFVFSSLEFYGVEF